MDSCHKGWREIAKGCPIFLRKTIVLRRNMRLLQIINQAVNLLCHPHHGFAAVIYLINTIAVMAAMLTPSVISGTIAAKNAFIGSIL